MTNLKLTLDQIEVIQDALDEVIRTGGARSAAVALPIIQEIDLQLNENACKTPNQP